MPNSTEIANTVKDAIILRRFLLTRYSPNLYFSH